MPHLLLVNTCSTLLLRSSPSQSWRHRLCVDDNVYCENECIVASDDAKTRELDGLSCLELCGRSYHHRIMSIGLRLPDHHCLLACDALKYISIPVLNIDSLMDVRFLNTNQSCFASPNQTNFASGRICKAKDTTPRLTLRNV